jgi:hypothetical protein
MKAILSLLFKTFMLTMTIYGLYLTFDVAASLYEVLGYFTTMVNVYTGIFTAAIILQLILYKQEGQRFYYFRQVAIVFLLLTSLVYSFLLIPYILSNDIVYEIWSLKDIVIHYLVPILFLIDYAFFSKKGTFKKHYVLLNLLFLIGYLFYLFIFLFFGGRFTLSGSESLFPYFFLNYDTLGWPLVIVIGVMITLAVLLLSWLVRLLDHIVGTPLPIKK